MDSKELNHFYNFITVYFPLLCLTLLENSTTGGSHGHMLKKFHNCSFNSSFPQLAEQNVDNFIGKKRNGLTVMLAADMLHHMEMQDVNNKARAKCKAMNSTYDEELMHCMHYKMLRNGTMWCHAEQETFPNSEDRATVGYWIYFIGNSLSLTGTVLLLVTYLAYKELHTSYGKCIVSLSVNTAFQQIMQIISIDAKDNTKQCKVVAVLHHWSYLAMFSWMASIAFDFSITFTRLRRPSEQAQKRRFKIYALISEVTPTALVSLCACVDFSSHNSYLGYGEENICFITNHTANIVVFSLPIVSTVIFNIICLSVALVFIAKIRRNSRLVLRNNSTRRNSHITFVIMALKLSFLLGIGWVFGPIGRLTQNKTIIYIYVFFSTFQGFFIFGAFCINQKVFHFYRDKFCARRTSDVNVLQSQPI